MPACPICESDESIRFLKSLRLLQCSSCGLVSSAEGSILSDYPSELHYSHRLAPQGLIEKLELFYIRMRWRREVHLLRRFITVGSSVLDIGCGNGEFLMECMRQGIHAEGIEKNFSPDSREKNIFKMDIERDELPQREYDAITLFHSLEHFKNPASVLDRLRERIKDGGIIIIQVPNIDSWQFRIFKGRWFHLFLPYHRYHFSTKTLCRLLEKKGFSVIHVRYFSNRWNPEGWSGSLLRWNPVYFIKKSREGHNALFQKLLYLFITIIFVPVSLLESILKKGGVITVVARKER